MIYHNYDHIWDCCCDHGFLGMHLLQKQKSGTVHFVDVIESLVDGVHQKLLAEPEIYPSDRWQTLCDDVANLPITATEQKREETHLVIIAGIGGDLLVELVKSITSTHSRANIEFLLCPVRQHYHVRKSLIDLNMKLINESLICEKKQYYEILHLSSRGTKELSVIGSMMWDLSDDMHCAYLKRTIEHYQRRLRRNSPETELTLQQYRALLAA